MINPTRRVVARRARLGGAILGFIGAIMAAGVAVIAQEIPSEFSAPSKIVGREMKFKVDIDVPDKSKPAPAVILMHGCGGLAPAKSNANWRQVFAKQGYVTLIVESFQARGWGNGVCAEPKYVALEGQLDRVSEAFAAAKFLRTLPFIDQERIVLMGFSHGAGTVLLAQTPYAKRELGSLGIDFDNPPFKALVANYPNCGRAGDNPVRKASLRAPLLIQIGADDDWTLAEWCKTLAELPDYKNHPGFRFRMYPGAYHQFDAGFRVVTLQTCGGAQARCGTTVHTGHNEGAFAEAQKETLSFLQDVAFK
jgi:dienelactone hydrolase